MQTVIWTNRTRIEWTCDNFMQISKREYVPIIFNGDIDLKGGIINKKIARCPCRKIYAFKSYIVIKHSVKKYVLRTARGVMMFPHNYRIRLFFFSIHIYVFHSTFMVEYNDFRTFCIYWVDLLRTYTSLFFFKLIFIFIPCTLLICVTTLEKVNYKKTYKFFVISFFHFPKFGYSQRKLIGHMNIHHR